MHWNRKLTRTMEIHHTKHDQAYIGNVSAALDGSGLERKSSEELISDLNAVPEANAL